MMSEEERYYWVIFETFLEEPDSGTKDEEYISRHKVVSRVTV
jgi:hypothetical protein